MKLTGINVENLRLVSWFWQWFSEAEPTVSEARLLWREFP